MERITYRITLDAHKSGIQRMLQGFETADNMTRRIDVSLVAGGETYELPENTAALIYITLPDASEPIINDCTIRDNTVVYDVLPITTEGITEMQIKLIEVSMEGARRVLVSPRFAVEVNESGTSDEGTEQTAQFTSLENAIAQAKAVYDSRIIGIDIGEDCTFRVYYADETVYENSNLHKALYKGNALLSESWAKGETGIREGEDINNSKYFSDVSRSAAKDASMVYDDANRILNEAIKHTAFTSFLVDFENGNLEYMSQNSTFNVNETNGDLEFELSNDYDPEKIIGEVVDEYIERKSTEINEKLENADAKTFGGKEPSYFATAADVKNANGKIDEIKNSILNTMEEIEANTQDDQLAGAGAVKELSEDVKNAAGIEITQAEYDALSDEEKANGTYWITDADTNFANAGMIPYSNTASGLGATNVQGAIDEVAQRFTTPSYDTQSIVGDHDSDISNAEYYCEEDGYIFAKVRTQSTSGTPFIRLHINGLVVFEKNGITGTYKYLWTPLYPVKKGDRIMYTLESTADGAHRQLVFMGIRR